MKRKGHVFVFDTTLRDGEQCPGASLGVPEKVQIARQLEKLGVDAIEAGFPAGSPADFAAVQRIAGDVRRARVAGLARCLEDDIILAADALAPAGKRARLHVFLATSPIHRERKLRMPRRAVLRAVAAGVRQARRYFDDVQFSAEDATRTEPAFLAEVARAALGEGASTFNVPDTVGYTVPEEFARLLAGLREAVPELDRAALHVHCHNDLGLAAANTLAAIGAGATGFEATINGIGERAGNCALEEVVMALHTRSDRYGAKTRIQTRELAATSRLVSHLTGMMVPRNKAIVGANAFAHEAGIHQDGVLKDRRTYEIMRPEDIGIAEPEELVLGRHSGRAGFAAHLRGMGLRLEAAHVKSLYEAFIDLADRKTVVYDDDLVALLRERLSDVPAVYTLAELRVETGSGRAKARVRLERDGRTSEGEAGGEGPVEAVLTAIGKATGVRGDLLSFVLQAVTRGGDAIGEASVQVRFGGRTVSAKGSDLDIVRATAKAYLNALNRHLCAAEGGAGV